MQDELHSLQSFNTWQLVERPPDTPIISCKWVFAIKTGQAGMPYRYKARLVARGCQQHAGIDYEETYAPVAKWNTLRSTAAIAAHRGWPILHMDVKTAYLNSLLKHRVYMLQPPGFAVKGKENYVLLLLRAIYGLKQSGRSWHQDIDAYLRYLHLIPTSSDSNLYYLHTPHKWILLILYVDDIFVTGNDSSHIQTICDQLQSKYQMTLLGAIQKYIGIEFLSTDQGLYLHQAAYIHHLLLESQMAQSNPSHTPLQQNVKLLPDMQSPLTDPTPYRRLVGKLIFLTNTRPDITHAVHQVARFMQTPQIAHLQAIHSILRYLRHTPNHGLFYARGDTGTLSGFTDADWGGASDNRRSVTGYLFKFGQSPITWTSKSQTSVSLSSTESEYRALMEGTREAIWLKRLLCEPNLIPPQSIPIYCDNLGSVKLSHNPTFHSRSKHFDIHLHFTREKVQEGEIEVLHIPTDQQPADILTKTLSRVKFEKCRELLGVLPVPIT